MSLVNSNSEQLRKYIRLDAEDFAQSFKVSEHGLSEHEAELIRKKYGNIDLTNQEDDSLARCIKRAFINPFSVVLFVLGIISLFTDVLLVGDRGSSKASVIIIFSMLLISGIVRLSQELILLKLTP